MIKQFRISLIILLVVSSFSAKAITVFAHGVADNGNQAKMLLREKTIFGPLDAFDFADAAKDKSWWPIDRIISEMTSVFGRSKHRPFGKQTNRGKMFMGQTEDIQLLTEKLNEHKDEPVILYGASRGAACAVSTLGEMKNINNIQALILESPPADMLDAIDNFSAKLGIPLPRFLFRKIFYKYPENPYTPFDAVKDITAKNKHLPIFIFTTAGDAVVNPSQPWKLYVEFKEAGCENVYICESPKGRHCKMHLLDEADAHNHYHAPVQAFYKRHGLLQEHYAHFKCNHIDIKMFQPTIEAAQQKIEALLDKRKKQYRYNFTRNIFTGALLASITAVYYYSQIYKKK